ncbi:MAG: hypothetical protein ACXV7G_11990 [Halobacteriota archaeon]
MHDLSEDWINEYVGIKYDRHRSSPPFIVHPSQVTVIVLRINLSLQFKRKRCIQCGCDTLSWELSNRSHILSHGFSSIEDKHYRHPLPEQIYDVYNRYWKDMKFTCG